MGVSRDMSLLKKEDNAVYHRGTPRYMAPEQLVQCRVEDPYKVEVFSLGVVLFRLVFKVYPFAPNA
jgi:serine/threonine protein kinase